jgi:hypothetical protein
LLLVSACSEILLGQSPLRAATVAVGRIDPFQFLVQLTQPQSLSSLHSFEHRFSNQAWKKTNCDCCAATRTVALIGANKLTRDNLSIHFAAPMPSPEMKSRPDSYPK